MYENIKRKVKDFIILDIASSNEREEKKIILIRLIKCLHLRTFEGKIFISKLKQA